MLPGNINLKHSFNENEKAIHQPVSTDEALPHILMQVAPPIPDEVSQDAPTIVSPAEDLVGTWSKPPLYENNNATPLTASPSRFTTTPDTRNFSSLSLTTSVSVPNLESFQRDDHASVFAGSSAVQGVRAGEPRRAGALVDGTLNLAELSHSLNSLGDMHLRRSSLSDNEFSAPLTSGLGNPRITSRPIELTVHTDRDAWFDPRGTYGDVHGEGRTTGGYSSEDFYSAEGSVNGSRRSDSSQLHGLPRDEADRFSQLSQHSSLPGSHFPRSHSARSLAQADDRLGSQGLDPYADEYSMHGRFAGDMPSRSSGGYSINGGYDEHPGRHMSGGGGGSGGGHYAMGGPDHLSPVISGFDGFVYKVQFKRAHRNFLRSATVDRPIRNGDFVVVEADRGEDLGVVCEVQPMPAFFREGGSLFAKDAKASAWGDRRSGVKHILRHALPQEYSLLPVKYAEEMNVAEVCRAQCQMYLLPMMVVDAEYQFDRHKLTIYYESHSRRIDFRELVRDLFAIYKTRIWMEAVSHSFRPHRSAARALATGTMQPESPSQTGPPSPRLESGLSLGLGGDPFDTALSGEPSPSVGGGRAGVAMRPLVGDPAMHAHLMQQQQQQHYYARPRQPQLPPQFDRAGGRGGTGMRMPMAHMGPPAPEYGFDLGY